MRTKRKEELMREEGYAAVSSRRVASVAGLKSQLVHYHFGTMDELFLALFQRAEAEYFERHAQAVTSSNPIRALWALSIDRHGMGLIFEFMALANHRELIRKQIAESKLRIRTMQVAMLTRALENNATLRDVCAPNVLSVLIAGAALQLVTETAIGVSDAHADTLAFADQIIAMIEHTQPKKKTRARKKAR
jgi:AcrR family transcriptional regulator